MIDSPPRAEDTPITMAVFMMANGKVASAMVKVFSLTPYREKKPKILHMMGNGKSTNVMAKVSIRIQMAPNTKVHGRMIKEMDLANLLGVMALTTKAT